MIVWFKYHLDFHGLLLSVSVRLFCSHLNKDGLSVHINKFVMNYDMQHDKFFIACV